MAGRRNSEKNDSTSTEAAEAVLDTVENTAVTPEEATATAEANEAPVEAKDKSDDEVDLTAFKAAAESAVAGADESDGEPTDEGKAAVLTEYRNLNGLKAKNAARAFLNDSMKTLMRAREGAKARAYLSLSEHMSAGSASGSKERTPADPTEAHVQLCAGLRLAVTLAGNNVPEGVASDWADKAKSLVSENTDVAQAYLAWFDADEDERGDEPEAPEFVKSAVKLARGRSAKVGRKAPGSTGNGPGYSGPPRSIGKHIAAAFASKNVGDFLLVSEIRTSKSDEYGDDLPSSGAISSALKSPNFKVEGVEPARNEANRLGARKV